MKGPGTRLLALIGFLQSYEDHSGHELAERLSVTPRTVRRDIERLRELGYVVRTLPGVAGYRLEVGSQVPTLMFEDDETVAVVVALKTVAAMGVEGDVAARALRKLEGLLPARLRYRVQSLSYSIDTVRGLRPRTSTQLVATLADCVERKERVRFEYVDREGTISKRDVEPYQIVHAGLKWYLMAWDISANDWRSFRVDRLRLRPPNGPRFDNRSTPDFVSRLERRVPADSYPFQGKILVALSDSVVTPMTHGYGFVEPIDADLCRVFIGGGSWARVTAIAVALDVDFEVEGPEEWMEHLDRAALRLSAAAAAVGSRSSQ